MTWRLRGWETIAAGAAAVSTAFVVPPNFFEPAVPEIVTVLGFLMAALVPAMMLGATALRAGRFSVRTLRALSSGIDRQIAVFGGLFTYALAACMVAVLGKLAGWRLPSIPMGSDNARLDPSLAFAVVLTFLLVLLILRAAAFIAGVRSVLRLSAAVAEDEARERDQAVEQKAADELEGYELPRSYGSRIELPH
jgi:hypothetical protein